MTSILPITLETFSPKFSLNHSCHLWLLDLTQLTDETITWHKMYLSDAELLRAENFTRKPFQLQFIAMRAFVRLCLSRYTDSTPKALEIVIEPKGKPYLANTSLPIMFNLSHSKNMAVLSVGLEYALGVDVEFITRKLSQHEIAQRYFHPQEAAHLEKLSEAEHNQYFFQLWTLKEALFKATGEGISAGLDNAAFSFGSESIQVDLAAELNMKAQDWQFYQTFIGTDYCASLARNSAQPLSITWFSGTDLFV